MSISSKPSICVPPKGFPERVTNSILSEYHTLASGTFCFCFCGWNLSAIYCGRKSCATIFRGRHKRPLHRRMQQSNSPSLKAHVSSESHQQREAKNIPPYLSVAIKQKTNKWIPHSKSEKVIF